MMRAHEVEKFKNILRVCFAQDEVLLKQWHVCAGHGLDACVEKTVSDLEQGRVRFYVVTEADELVGYFGREELDQARFLTGFFLLPKFRNEVSRILFWDLIEVHFEKPFYCGLYEKNEPANRFIQARGGKPIRFVTLKDGPAVYYELGA